MSDRIFDPHAGSNSMLVATFDGQVRQGEDYKSLLEEVARDREMRDIARIMHQRTGVCG